MIKQEIKSFEMSCKGHSGLSAVSPCSLYSVLAENGIVGDIYTDCNADGISHHAEQGCVFTSQFDVSALIMSMKCVFLRFSGICGACTAELNGREIARMDNMFRTYSCDVKKYLKLGMNTLTLSFSRPGQAEVRRSAVSGMSSAPSVTDLGIFRGAELVCFNNKIISAVKIKQTHSDNSVVLGISLETLGYDNMSRAVATLTSPAGNVYFCGLMNNEGTITVTDPNLWWPNGLGMQSLYKLSISLYSESEVEDSREIYLGLRTVELVRDGLGKPEIRVNGVPFFPMGAQIVPDGILPHGENGRMRSIAESAKSANLNSFIIHGMGYYPDQAFYEACDRCGITVWQQIPDIGGAKLSDEMKSGIKAEICENIAEASIHPSMCVVLGSEDLAGIFDSDSERSRFEELLSPHGGMNIADIGGSIRDSLSFVSYPSLPTYSSIKKFTSPKERNIGSLAFELHGASDETASAMISSSYNVYPYANGMKELSYTTGMCAADMTEAQVFELRRSVDKPLGIFLGQFNDMWGCVSPSSVDYYGGLKPLYYRERRMFAPVCVMLEMRGTRARFTLTNSSKADYHGVFAYSVMDNSNKPVFRDSFPIRLRASSDMDVHNVDLGSVILGHENEYYLIYSVTDNALDTSRFSYLFTKPKRFEFSDPNFKTEITGHKTVFSISISADGYAKGVELSFEDIDAEFSDNYFDITSRAPVKIDFTTASVVTPEKLKRLLRIKSVYDLGHEK